MKVTEWKSLKQALRESRHEDASMYIEDRRAQNPEHANDCERLLFHHYNGRGMWPESFDLATNSVGGKDVVKGRLRRLKQMMEAWGDQNQATYGQVVESLAKLSA